MGIEAQLIGGVWFPPHERHLTEMVLNHSKVPPVTLRDGRTVHCYQKHKLDAALRRCPSMRTAIDVGGHVGLWSMHLAETFAQVHAFEPVPDLRELFGRNVTASNVELHETALSDRPGRVTLDFNPADTGNTHLSAEATAEMAKVTAETRPLDAYAFEDVDFIKIDVEGTEADVVRGARETILACKPVVVVEQKGNDAKWYGRERDEAAKLLWSWGYASAEVLAGDHIMVWRG